MMSIYKKLLPITALALFAGLAGCASKVELSSDGHVFPQTKEHVYQQGIYPNTENLANVKPGLSSKQVLALIGEPHFGEGFGAKTWNYWLHFRELSGGEESIRSCQLQLGFDAKKIVTELYWLPKECSELLVPKPPEPLEVAELSADVLFEFDSYKLTAGGYQELAKVAGQIKEWPSSQLVVEGHTDEIGSPEYNQKLSENRAQAVASTLQMYGVSSIIEVVGKGYSHPVVDCSQVTDISSKVDCLSPNRRVEISAKPLIAD